ncbi:MAG: hypothetical protein IAG13_34485 [Deltaproteobacteria bacterium]|nr:hypothetical protein [Nannocystaceae bacterium]
MTLALAQSAEKVLRHEVSEGAAVDDVATAAVQAFDKLTHHFSRLVGASGMRMLLARAVASVRPTYPWLPRELTTPADAPWADLRTALAEQAPEVAAQAFAALWSDVVGLLGRFIGDRLVGRLLRELWPQIFPAGLMEEQR